MSSLKKRRLSGDWLQSSNTKRVVTKTRAVNCFVFTGRRTGSDRFKSQGGRFGLDIRKTFV